LEDVNLSKTRGTKVDVNRRKQREEISIKEESGSGKGSKEIRQDENEKGRSSWQHQIHEVGERMMQSSQGEDPSPEPWLGDSRKIGSEMQEKALGFS